MSLTSYAVNFEDVLLWRALRDVRRGCYLEVGAAGPRIGSASQLFYEQGWRGVNLTASLAQLRQLRIARPADVCLPALAAASAGSVVRLAVPDAPG
ncbi:FkbM family methyltransferase, partial [Duganella sp. FT50W]|nr:FkbM family methyltransferase [Duganella lactea]